MSLPFELVVRQSGAVRVMTVLGSDAADACFRAAQDGLLVLTCTPQRSRAGKALPRAVGSRSGFDIATLSYELSSLLSAGLSVLEALRTLAAKERNAGRRQMLLDVVTGVGNGLPLSAAMAGTGGRFPELLIATISASEQTGDLSVALRRYAEHQQSVRAIRDKVVGAAVYPLLLLVLGSGVVLFLLTVVVPKFAVLIESSRKDLPWSSELMMSWGRFAAAHAGTMAAIGATVLLAVLFVVRRTLRSGAKARWVEALPLAGSTVRRFRHAQLYRTTGMLVRGGIAAPRALGLATTLLGEADQRRLQHAIAMIQEGRGLSAALLDAGLADPVASSMLAVAERTGALAEILERIAQFHEASLQRSVELASRLFEPVLMIVIGLVIGAIVVLMYLPIFDLASSLQ